MFDGNGLESSEPLEKSWRTVWLALINKHFQVCLGQTIAGQRSLGKNIRNGAVAKHVFHSFLAVPA